MDAGPLLVLPVGAAATAFVLVAVPVMVLMGIWACVTVARILWPERPLPFDAPSRRERALRRGESRPVGVRDILDDEARRRRAPSARPRPRETAGGPPAAERPSLSDDLWLRRN